jgi:hypothetical protein
MRERLAWSIGLIRLKNRAGTIQRRDRKAAEA